MISPNNLNLDAAAFLQMQILEAGGDALVILDSEWRYIYVNDRALPVHARSREELVGHKVVDVFPDIVSTKFWDVYHRAARDHAFLTIEDYFAPLDTWFDIRVIPQGDLLFVHFQDVTAQKKAEGRERAREGRERDRLRAIFLQAPAFMAALRGPQHVYELANLPYHQLIGRQSVFEAQEIIGKTVAEVIPEMVEQGFIALMDQVYRTGEAFVGNDIPVSFQRYSGGPMDEHFVNFTFQPLFDEDDKVSGILVHGIDLTDRKRLEQERERLIEQQEQLVVELHEAGRRQRRFLKEMLAGFTEGRLNLCFDAEDMPAPLPPQSDPIALSPSTLRQLRARIQSVADGWGMSMERLQEFETAVHEAAVNAMKYGGSGNARVHGDPVTGRMQVWVTDNGPGIAEDLIHRAVERGYTTAGFGHGMFLMQSYTDCLYLMTGAGGTTIVLEKERIAPEPAWLKTSA